MTEPGCGSDLQAISTLAERDGGERRLNGSKTFITNGQLANLVCVAARTGEAKGGRGVSLVFVETEDAPGFRRGQNLEKIGMKGQDTSELFFEDLRVPESNLLAEAKTKTEVLRSFVNDCVERLDAGSLDPATASMAKWWGSQMQCEVADECLQLFGGYGYMAEYPIARLYSDARVQKIYAGANEVMKELIARSLDT